MHELTQTTLDENTLIQTSVDSYIFTCPVCLKEARYAYSFNDKIEVFCNGEDFGTKIPVSDVVLEISEAYCLVQNTALEEVPPVVIEGLEEKGLIEVTENEYVPTEKGLSVTEELK